MNLIEATKSALCVTLAFSAAACDSEIRFHYKSVTKGPLETTLISNGNIVSFEMRETDSQQPPEKFEFTCADQSPIKNALARAVKDETVLAEELSKGMKSVTAGNITAESINAMIPLVKRSNASKAKVAALQEASNICNPSLK